MLFDTRDLGRRYWKYRHWKSSTILNCRYDMNTHYVELENLRPDTMFFIGSGLHPVSQKPLLSLLAEIPKVEERHLKQEEPPTAWLQNCDPFLSCLTEILQVETGQIRTNGNCGSPIGRG